MATRRNRDEEELLAEKYPFSERIVMTETEICETLTAKAAHIKKHYDGKVSESEPLIVVCVLKGSAPSHTILCRELARINVPHVAEYLCVSSYGSSSTSCGEVRVLLDLRSSIQKRHVLIVEDICESGRTLSFLQKVFACRNPASVELLTLLDKPACRKVDDVRVRWVCKELPDDGSFLVGGGLDWNERMRTLPDVVVLKKEVYCKIPHHAAAAAPAVAQPAKN